MAHLAHSRRPRRRQDAGRGGWVRGLALGLPRFTDRPAGRIALVGETLGDVRAIMVEGVSGLLALHPGRERPLWSATKRQLVWATTGAVVQAFSSEDPESLRAPSSPPPGATSWQNGSMPRRPGTCCSSGFGWGGSRARW